MWLTEKYIELFKDVQGLAVLRLVGLGLKERKGSFALRGWEQHESVPCRGLGANCPLGDRAWEGQPCALLAGEYPGLQPGCPWGQLGLGAHTCPREWEPGRAAAVAALASLCHGQWGSSGHSSHPALFLLSLRWCCCSSEQMMRRASRGQGQLPHCPSTSNSQLILPAARAAIRRAHLRAELRAATAFIMLGNDLWRISFPNTRAGHSSQCVQPRASCSAGLCQLAQPKQDQGSAPVQPVTHPLLYYPISQSH